MELDFRKSPQVLSKIVDAMADGVFTVNAEGYFVAWSEGAERITGYSSKEVVGQPCHFMEGPNCKGFSKLTELLNPASQPLQGICHQECKLLSKDQKELYLHGNIRVLQDKENKIIGAVGTFSDMTSFFQANEKIALLEKEKQHQEKASFQKIVGKSYLMKDVFRQLKLAAQSEVNVLLTGESGTGKELAAKAIHAESLRKEKPFLAINCSAIPETLLESELFGHTRGAFTGAIKEKTGLFQTAQQGTLFLDEIGDISLHLQLKLLRVLQEKEIRRVGDEKTITINVRLLFATNKNLKKRIQEGQFREDFYYRIHVFEINLPPLTKRKEDIPLLIEHFINHYSKTYHKAVGGISHDALRKMLDYSWPGNVRELQNAIEHAFVTIQGEQITLLDLPREIREPARSESTSSTPSSFVPEVEAQYVMEEHSEQARIEEALQKTRGNKTKAAKLLGMSRVTLWKRMQKFKIE